jgi:hypothetical protein
VCALEADVAAIWRFRCIRARRASVGILTLLNPCTGEGGRRSCHPEPESGVAMAAEAPRGQTRANSWRAG